MADGLRRADCRGPKVIAVVSKPCAGLFALPHELGISYLTIFLVQFGKLVASRK